MIGKGRVFMGKYHEFCLAIWSHSRRDMILVLGKQERIGEIIFCCVVKFQ